MDATRHRPWICQNTRYNKYTSRATLATSCLHKPEMCATVCTIFSANLRKLVNHYWCRLILRLVSQLYMQIQILLFRPNGYDQSPSCTMVRAVGLPLQVNGSMGQRVNRSMGDIESMGWAKGLDWHYHPPCAPARSRHKKCRSKHNSWCPRVSSKF